MCHGSTREYVRQDAGFESLELRVGEPKSGEPTADGRGRGVVFPLGAQPSFSGSAAGLVSSFSSCARPALGGASDRGV